LFQALEKHGPLARSSHRLLSKLDGAQLDREIDTLMRRPGFLACAFAWQLAGYMLGALEVYWALAFFGPPCIDCQRPCCRSATQAVGTRVLHAAGLGVQEAAIMVLAHMAGVDRRAGIALALVKRMREVLFAASRSRRWQLAEVRHNARSRLT